MNSILIMNAIGSISDDLIAEAAINNSKYKSAHTPAFRWKLLVAAILAIALLAVPVSAEVINGYVSNLLAPIFGGAQTEIVDKIGKPIGATASTNGYTLTVEAVIGDRHNAAVVYTLEKEDGAPIPDKAYFEDWNTVFLTGNNSGGTLSVFPNKDDPSKIHIIEFWHDKTPLIGRLVHASFSNLVFETQSESIQLASGPWEVKYTFRYEDASQNVPVRDLSVKDKSGKQYRINKISISPIGLYMDLTIVDPEWGAPHMQHFEASLLLSDGSLIEMKGGGGGGGHQMGDKTMEAYFSAVFETPVDLNSIEAIIICGTPYDITK